MSLFLQWQISSGDCYIKEIIANGHNRSLTVSVFIQIEYTYTTAQTFITQETHTDHNAQSTSQKNTIRKAQSDFQNSLLQY